MINTVYVIAGPTAIGKSDLSISLANKVNGTVINSDSMQVYKNLEILTARPSISEMKNIYNDPNYSEVQKMMHKRFEEMRDKYGDSDELDQMHIENYLSHLKKRRRG